LITQLTLSLDVFRRTSQANSFTVPSLSTCECCNNKHAGIKYDINYPRGERRGLLLGLRQTRVQISYSRSYRQSTSFCCTLLQSGRPTFITRVPSLRQRAGRNVERNQALKVYDKPSVIWTQQELYQPLKHTHTHTHMCEHSPGDIWVTCW